MINAPTEADADALRMALVTLDQVARRSTDRNSRVLAEGAVRLLCKHVPNEMRPLSPLAEEPRP